MRVSGVNNDHNAPVPGMVMDGNIARGGRLRGRRMPLRACLATLVVLGCVMAPVSTASAAAVLLPDLVADPPENPDPLQVEDFGAGPRLVMRFDGYIHNKGPGPLEMRGSGRVGNVMTVTEQRIYRDDSSSFYDGGRNAQIIFETADGHDHWHLKNAARYSLWNEAGTAQVATSAKVGFCLEDSAHVDPFGPSAAAYSNATIQRCKENQPSASSVYQGISSGWRDIYWWNLPFQWIDVSDVQPGRYRLASQMDPDDIVIESNEQNNGPGFGQDIVTVPGHLATPVTVSAGGPVTITLPAASYGTTGGRASRIESAPAHGTLHVAAGTTFAGDKVVYTPQPGFAGTDRFTFSTPSTSSLYPLHPAPATVTVQVPGSGSLGKGARLLGPLRMTRRGGKLIVKGRVRRSGTVRARLTKGKRTLESCRRRVRAGRLFRCRIDLPSVATARKSKVIARLRVNGRLMDSRKARVPRRLLAAKRAR
jgi:hypothetical protein